MTVSAAKPEEKRLGWFVPTAVDQAESCVKPAAEGRNLARMPNPQHSETERLDHGPNWLKHTEDGLLLGECRLKMVAGSCGSLLRDQFARNLATNRAFSCADIASRLLSARYFCGVRSGL